MTDLSGFIVWTDQTGTTLGTGSSLDVMLGVGANKITASVTDPVSGLVGMAGTVITVPDSNQPVVLFSESFENGWSGLSTQDSQNDWFISTQRSTDGNRSAEVDGKASNATLTVDAPIDLSGYESAQLSFDWYIEGSFDSGEYVKLDFFDGSTWNEILSLDGNVDAENTWHSELVQLDSQYLISNFQFRYRASANRSDEDANVDNVELSTLGTAGPPNQLPTITSTAVIVATQDQTYSYDVDASDPDAGDTLSFSLDQSPSGMSIASSTGVITWVPGSSQVGTNDVTVRVEDQRGGSASQSFIIDVANVDDPPTIDSLPVTVGTEGVVYTYDVDADDPDPGDVLTYSLDVMPTGMSIDSSSGIISWTPGSEHLGATNDVTVRVTDIEGGFDTQSFTVDVSAPSLNKFYVYDIRFDSKRGNKDWRAVVEIRSDSNSNGQGDAGDNPLIGVQVSFIFKGQTFSGVTDSNGIFRSAWINNLPRGNYYANVVDLAFDDYQWDTALDLENDSDGIAGPDDLLIR